ncbi:hypothetical protein [Bacillus sp. NPDC094106]|uniref:hypothetical protein n=1 Tax=Bacillus sp. NPDC094106 TaxID=3363949 RepID=UPI003805FF36
MRDLLDEVYELLDESIIQIEEYKKILKKIEETPFCIMTDLFNGNDILLPYVLLPHGEDALLSFQDMLYQYLVPELEKFIALEQVELSYDIGMYPSPIIISVEGVQMGYISIQERKLYYLENEQEEFIKAKIHEQYDKLEQLKHRQEELELHKQNPLAIGGANPIKLASIALRKKKYIKQLQQDTLNLDNEAFEIRREIQSLENQLQAIQEKFIEHEYFLERIERKLKNKFSYQIVKNK